MPAFLEIFRQAKSLFVDNPAEAYTKFTGGREYGFLNEGGLERAIYSAIACRRMPRVVTTTSK